MGFVRNIPVVSPARTIVDLAALLEPPPLARIVEDARRRGLCTAQEVTTTLAQVADEGEPGRPALRSMLADRVQADSDAYAEAGWRVLFVTSRTSPNDVYRQLRRFLREK